MTVYIVQETNKVIKDRDTGEIINIIPVFNFAPAKAYGELSTLLPPGDVTLAPQPLVSLLRPLLKDFSEDDYIVPTGDPFASMVAATIAASFNRGRYKVLRWDKRYRQYTALQYNILGGET